MPYIRKDTAGSTSQGHVWPEDGAVIEIPHDDAEELLVIPDGGFSLADAPSESDGAQQDAPEDDAPELTEVIPDSEETVTEPDATTDEPVTKTVVRRSRKTTAED